MSDSESASAAPLAHPHVGGKSLQAIERPRYKSWRKKYRKLRHQFDGVLEENKRLFKEEQKLDSIAKRLKEELDELLELCLDLNQNPSIPPELRFNVSFREHYQSAGHGTIPDNISPEKANDAMVEYTHYVQAGQMPPADLFVMREHIDDKLAAQEVEALHELERSVPQPVPRPGDAVPEAHVRINDGEEVVEPVNWLSIDQEDAYLARLDANNPPEPYNRVPAALKEKERETAMKEEKHWAELTPREWERHVELLNPQSQHNWLKIHTKVNTNLGGGDDDADSIASHDGAKSSRKRAGKDKNLAKQVGDRAVERAREGRSPGAGDAGPEEDELGLDAGYGGGKKRARDPDGTYRVKGGSSGNKGKRKRSGEDIGNAGSPAGGSSLKKAKVEGD